MADRQFVVGGVEAAPADWIPPAPLEIIPRTAFATFDGKNAAGEFLPCLEIISDSGHTVCFCVPEVTVAAGASAIVSFFPGGAVGEDTSGSSTASGTVEQILSPLGTISIASASGPITSIDLPASGVAAGTYGDSGNVAQVTVNAEGVVTAVSAVSIAGGGSVVGSDGWVPDTNAPTFATANSFTAGASDLTAVYSVGTRIKLTQTTVKYFVVTASVFGAGTTTVTVSGGSDYTLANAAITTPFYSYVVNPQGFPGWFNWTPTVTGFTGATTNTFCRFSQLGRVTTFSIDIQGTSNAAGFTISLPPGFTTVTGQNQIQIVRVTNSGAAVAGSISVTSLAQTVLTVGNGPAQGAAFTTSGSKGVSSDFPLGIL